VCHSIVFTVKRVDFLLAGLECSLKLDIQDFRVFYFSVLVQRRVTQVLQQHSRKPEAFLGARGQPQLRKIGFVDHSLVRHFKNVSNRFLKPTELG
jgi:hypothetical protein